MNRALLAVAGLALLASGCATRGSVTQLRFEVTSLRTALADLRATQEQMAHDNVRLFAGVKSVEDRLADVQSTARQTNDQIAQLRARLDATDARVIQTRAALDAIQKPEVISTAPASPTPREPSPTSAAADRAFATALALFRAGEHGQAVLDFTDFIAKYPRHPLASQAQYWIGEAYFLQRDYRQAAIEFDKVVEAGRDVPRAADALLKIGLCQARLRDGARAQQTWQRVVREYPGAEAAARARSLLAAGAAATTPR